MFTMTVLLREGFRDHTVVITMNDRPVYDGAGVTTDPLTARAGTIAVTCLTAKTRVGITVSPGDLRAAFDVDLSAHPHVAISLVGARTLAFETSTVPFA
jgi:hypothetical protein